MRALVRILLLVLMASVITTRFWFICEPMHGWPDLLWFVMRALMPINY